MYNPNQKSFNRNIPPDNNDSSSSFSNSNSPDVRPPGLQNIQQPNQNIPLPSFFSGARNNQINQQQIINNQQQMNNHNQQYSRNPPHPFRNDFPTPISPFGYPPINNNQQIHPQQYRNVNEIENHMRNQSFLQQQPRSTEYANNNSNNNEFFSSPQNNLSPQSPSLHNQLPTQNLQQQPSGVDQMLVRMRIMAQQHENAKRQQQMMMNQSNQSNNSNLSFFSQLPKRSPFDNSNPQQPIILREDDILQQVNNNSNDNKNEQIESLPSSSLNSSENDKSNSRTKVIISEPTEETELFEQPQIEVTLSSQQEDIIEKEKYSEILLSAPPPDPNRTGAYLTNRSKRILAKLPELSMRKEIRINNTINELLIQLEPSNEIKEKRKDLLNRLQDKVSSIWTDYNPKLYLYGSSANRFAIKGHDIDVCLQIDPNIGTKGEIIETLADNFTEDEVDDIKPLIWARVPILKFKDSKTQLSCDICINNILAIRNTKLLADYSAIDPRLRILVLVVKYWAKRRMINETFSGTLSSYAYVLMVIQFLQTCKPPILPCLQQLIDENTEKVIIQGFDCTYNEDIQSFYQFGQHNRDSPAKLLVDFFRFYGFEFDYIHSVICVRTGGFLSKDIKQWMIPSHPRECCFFGLEDPFDTTHNLGRVVDKPGMDTIRNEFERGYKILVKTGDFERCTREFTPENPDTRW